LKIAQPWTHVLRHRGASLGYQRVSGGPALLSSAPGGPDQTGV